MDYGEIITRAWNITWNNKFLWVLGFLAALTSGSSNNNSFRYSMNEGDFISDPQTAAQMSALAMLLMCVFGIIGLILWVLSVIARGGLIDSVNRIDDGEKVTLGEAFSAGVSAIWRLIGIYLLAYLPLIIISFVIAGLFIVMIGGSVAATALMQNPEEIGPAIGGSIGILAICICLFICALIPLTMIITMVAEFASRSAVIQKMGIIESLRHGWQVLKNNLGPIILLGIILFVFGFVIVLVIGAIMFPLGFAVMLPIFTSLSSDGSMSGIGFAYMGLSAMCLGVLLALLMSVFQTWGSAIWTLAYKEFTGKSPDFIPAEKVA